MTTLYCILAREADTAVIFRRGPSKHVRLITWDLKTHTFTPGQWFKGRIYADKSDLSPDGTKLVYYAAKHQRGELPTWIAVSTPPYLTAHVLWEAFGTWNDISLFETNSKLRLATYRSDSSIEPHPGFQTPRKLQIQRKPWPGFFYRRVDHDRLIRDGWAVLGGDPVYNSKLRDSPTVSYRKAVSAHGFLRATLTGKYDDAVQYELHNADGTSIAVNAQWADVRNDVVYYSKDGKLMRLLPGHLPELLADFSDMTYEGIEAPDWAKVW